VARPNWFFLMSDFPQPGSVRIGVQSLIPNRDTSSPQNNSLQRTRPGRGFRSIIDLPGR